MNQDKKQEEYQLISTVASKPVNQAIPGESRCAGTPGHSSYVSAKCIRSANSGVETNVHLCTFTTRHANDTCKSHCRRSFPSRESCFPLITQQTYVSSSYLCIPFRLCTHLQPETRSHKHRYSHPANRHPCKRRIAHKHSSPKLQLQSS